MKRAVAADVQTGQSTRIDPQSKHTLAGCQSKSDLVEDKATHAILVRGKDVVTEDKVVLRVLRRRNSMENLDFAILREVAT